jgi:hypothetical protein
MTEKQQPSSVRLVTSNENRPCGCVMTEYSDKTRSLQPCPPCGLMASSRHFEKAAQELGMASQALGAVAQALRGLQNEAQIGGAIHNIMDRRPK